MPDERTIRIRGKVFHVHGRRRIGRRQYLILQTLGRAGRKRYLAYDPDAGPEAELRLRQILVLPRNRTSRQHIRVLSRLSQGNPNLPRILEYHQKRGEIEVVTTWVWGDDLGRYLESAKRGRASWPSPVETCKLFRGLAHGLSQLHKGRNVVHGDIKPANLVLTREPNRLVMIDFGSAWLVEETVRRLPGDGLSEYYAAPEQLMKDPSVDLRSDQFSASLVAYEMLTREIPYARMGGLAGLPENRPVFEPRYRPPSRQNAGRSPMPRRIWRIIDEVISTGLALDPQKRYATGAAWLDALEDLHCSLRTRPKLGFWNNKLLQFLQWGRNLFFRR